MWFEQFSDKGFAHEKESQLKGWTRKKKEALKLLQMKFLPEHYEFPSTIIIYGDKVVIIVWTELLFGFLIKSKEVAKSNMNFFDILWKIAKKQINLKIIDMVLFHVFIYSAKVLIVQN